MSDSDSNRAFKIINKMVESSSDFRALSGCAQVSFQTTWAFVVTWREVRYFDDVCDKVGTVHINMYFTYNIHIIYNIIRQ